MMKKTIHIIGAGLAGLAAAVALKDRDIALYEMTGHAGGRCYSYDDKTLGCELNNGSHLVMGCNPNVLKYIRQIGAGDCFTATMPARYAFFDAKTKERWEMRGLPRLPLWESIKLLCARKHHTVDDIFAQDTEAYRKFIKPFVISALNTTPDIASAAMLRKVAIKLALTRGGMVPYVARYPLSKCLVDPALTLLPPVQYHKQLTDLKTRDDCLTALRFTDGEVVLSSEDTVILAVPEYVAARLLPEMHFPNQFSSIINLHFAYDTSDLPKEITGVIGGITEWIFIHEGVISVTISAADALLKDEITTRVWQEVQAALGISASLPPSKIIRDKRSTFLATPANIARRPCAITPYRNLFLAGNYIDTGYPATLESAIKSGFDVAKMV